MIKYLEEKLYIKTKDTQSDILYAQWNYDKRLIPIALQAITNLFPHYSLHDVSHSITIINNIVRVLGKDNIDKLSAIDLWMILEASFYHDIGMVIPSEKLSQAINSQDFIQFFKDLQKDKKNSLFNSANLFDIEDNKIRYKNNYFDLDIFEGIKFILAEYFRKIHANRSKEIINNPSTEISLFSPRGIIPPRIFNILGEICSCHTKNFEDVLKLPFCEVGIDTEDAHPRFIACMLRIGDLLDLDNNRFSEVILRTLNKIPIETLRHKSKHLSIESFRSDRQKIEITAKCNNYETANLIQHWFNYLNSEISSQMTKWNDIVPSKEIGYLPTVGDLNVELLDYNLIDGKNKPKFSVDTDKALSLLQGAGIYDGASQCIREILQNSVDASLIRMWLEYNNIEEFNSPQNDYFIAKTKEFPLSIEINSKGKDGEDQMWELIFQDNGTGISANDLRYLMNTGSSSKNKERNAIIESMPEWMRPSGTFGIGFQSIFMLTESINLETKSYFTEQLQFIELNSPNSIKDGDILIQKKASNHSRKPGTKLICNYKTSAIPDGYSIKGEHRYASRIAHNFDPFLHDSMDIEIGKVVDEVFNFSNKCYFPVLLSINGDKIKTQNSEKKKFDYYDSHNSLELSLFFKEGYFQTITYYKNQNVANHLRFNFLQFSLNIHKEKASEVLTLNRNKIKPEFEAILFSQLLDSAFRIIIENFDNIFKDPKQKAIGSMFLNFYSENYAVKNINIKQFNQWEKFEVPIEEKKIKMKDLLDKVKSITLVNIILNTPSYTSEDTYKLIENKLVIELISSHPVFGYTTFLLYKAISFFPYISIITKEDGATNDIIFSKEKPEEPISNQTIINILKHLKGGNSFSARTFIPCSEDFVALRITDNAQSPYVFNYILHLGIYIPIPKMLSPYVAEEDSFGSKKLKVCINDKLIDWVYENRFDIKTTKEDITKTYDEFINKFSLDKL